MKTSDRQHETHDRSSEDRRDRHLNPDGYVGVPDPHALVRVQQHRHDPPERRAAPSCRQNRRGTDRAANHRTRGCRAARDRACRRADARADGAARRGPQTAAAVNISQRRPPEEEEEEDLPRG